MRRRHLSNNVTCETAFEHPPTRVGVLVVSVWLVQAAQNAVTADHDCYA